MFVTQSKTASIESPVKKETTKQNRFLTNIFSINQSIFYFVQPTIYPKCGFMGLAGVYLGSGLCVLQGNFATTLG